ncbi:signal peptide peptidase-like 2B isoform X1 [Limulus polyphemus]|uniref:Signal peptide peptidase-like 2B isoform X1 n=1 Tax=Limulus polyphemus TaxID=6850 RepID=A0ABM1T9Y2_LIMPO|nr:signal peptide peptidase-like 2B isoform X1 [Limulus polyphemus]
MAVKNCETVIWRVVDFYVIITLILTYFKEVGGANYHYGVLAAESSSESKNFCIMYLEDFLPLPTVKQKEDFRPLLDQSNREFCDTPPPEYHPSFEEKVVLVRTSNCSVVSQAQVVQNLGGAGLLVTVPEENMSAVEGNSSLAQDINITVALISDSSVRQLENLSADVRVLLFAPDSFNVDFSLFIIWVVAVFTVAVGSCWSGLVKQSLHLKETTKLSGTEIEHHGKPQTPRESEESSMRITPILVAVFVLCMGAMLLLLYFFFDYLVYFIISLFVLASMVSVYSCLEPCMKRLSIGTCRLPPVNFLCFKGSLEVYQVVVFLFAVALTVSWVIIRKESYSWILQDILGIAFSINMLKSVRLPSLKICTILLVLLFFYDIFFVFITPFLTVFFSLQKGESVMVEVATGGSSQEVLPMVLRVPHFNFDPMSVCYKQYSLLGFGDILVPGLLVAYCHGYDLLVGNRRVYFITTTVCYGLGLIITFFGLYLMRTPQPALLYLVPATLIPPILLGLVRKELSHIWNGYKYAGNEQDLATPPVEIVEPVPTVTNNENEENNPVFSREGSGASSEYTEYKNLLHS